MFAFSFSPSLHVQRCVHSVIVIPCRWHVHPSLMPPAFDPVVYGVAGEIIRRNKIDIDINPSVDKISDCDIICTATTSSVPVFEDGYIHSGTHINAVGAYQVDKREIPGDTIRRSKLVVDQRSACLREAGDLIIPISEKLINEDHIYAELGELIDGDKAGRSDDSEITIFKSVGNAAQDLITAEYIFKFASRRGIGTSLAL